MANISPVFFKKIISDQSSPLYLIDPAKLTEEELDKFSTSLKEVMGYIKYPKDKEKLLEFLRTDTRKTRVGSRLIRSNKS